MSEVSEMNVQRRAIPFVAEPEEREAFLRRLADGIAAQVAPRMEVPRVEVPPLPAPLYTPATLAERLAVGMRTAREILERGDIPSFKISPQARRIDPEEVEAYIERCRRGEAA